MEFNRVIDGIIRYLNREIFVGLNDWQDIMARVAISRMVGNRDQLKQTLMGNGFLQTLGIVDSRGMVDVEGLADDLRNEIRRKGKLVIKIPLLGTFTFTESDVDTLYGTIVEG